jgi:hypothetical protein
VTGDAIPEPAAVVDPAGRRHRLVLSPAGHVALFARALHVHQPGEVRRRTGARALVEAVAVTRDGRGQVHPRRSAHPANFPACGNVAALQAIAAASRQAGRECWCAPLARTAPVPGGRSVPGGRLLWADADTPDAVERARLLWRTVPARLVVESAGAPDPAERRLHLYLLTERWLDPDELEAANAALAARLGSDRVGDRGRLMRLPGTRNLQGGGAPGRFCRVLARDLHAPGVPLTRIAGGTPLRTAQRPPRGRNRTQMTGGAFAPATGSRGSSPTGRSPATATPLPAARQADPVPEALRRPGRRLVLLGLRAPGRPHRVRRLAPARPPRPRGWTARRSGRCWTSPLTPKEGLALSA